MKIRSYVASVEGRWGTCYYIKDDEYVGRSIKNYGEYNPDETEFLLALAAERPDSLVLDIGANIGVMAQALKASGYRVEAFEPQKAVYDILCLNFNGAAHNCALGASAGTAYMPKQVYHARGNFGGCSLGSGDVAVEVRTLDSFEYADIGVIKLDVEGFEEQVLRGGVETIAHCRPLIYLEADRVEKIPALKAYVAELGYSWEEHKPLLYRHENYFSKHVNVWAPMNYASHNVLCRPL